jgi:hypothetical protein
MMQCMRNRHVDLLNTSRVTRVRASDQNEWFLNGLDSEPLEEKT